MAYTDPIFYFRHAVRDAGDAAITTTHSPPDPTALLLDDRLDTFYSSDTGVQTSHTIDVDRGTGTLGALDTIILARGNHFDTSPVTQMDLVEDNDVAFGSTNSLRSILAAGASDDPIWVVPFNGSYLGERYVRLVLSVASSSKIFKIGEYWLTEKVTLTRGPEPQWRQDFVSNVQSSETDAGVEYFRIRGAARKRFRMTWRKLTGADLTALKTDLLTEAAHTAHPFWFQPPDDEYGVGYYRLANDIQVRMDSPVPSAVETFRVDLDLIEALG